MKAPNVDLRAWRQFLAVAEELHFGRAAQRLFMTQPPLTQGIAQLERTLGVRLFDRTRRSVRLTAAGEALLPEVRELLARAAKLPPLARATAQGDAGHLRLAFVSTIGFTLLPGLVRGFRERHPEVSLELIEASSNVQLTALEREELDGGFVLHSPGLAPAGLPRLPVATESFTLALPEQHPLAEAATLNLREVLAEPLVIFPRALTPSLHDAIFALYHHAGRIPQIAQEALQMQTIVNLVSAGLGIAWVPSSVRQFRRAGVVYRDIKPGTGRTRVKIPECETSLVWTPRSGPAMQRFVAFVEMQHENRGA